MYMDTKSKATVTPSHKSSSYENHIRQLLWNWVGCGYYFMAATGSTWLLQGLHGCYRVFVALTGSTSRSQFAWILRDKFPIGVTMAFMYLFSEYVAMVIDLTLRVGHTKSCDRLWTVATSYRKWTQVNVQMYVKRTAFVRSLGQSQVDVSSKLLTYIHLQLPQWSHEWCTFDLRSLAFTWDNLSQPSVTYRNSLVVKQG